MYGIENLKKAFAILIESGNIAGQIVSIKDGKWYQKLGPVINILDEAIDLIKVDWKLIPKEIADLSPEEKKELNEFFIKKFSIPQENVEVIVEKSFLILLSTATAIAEIVELSKALKSSKEKDL